MINDIIEFNHKSERRINKLFIKIKAKLGFIAEEGKYKNKSLNILSFFFSKEGASFFKKVALRFFYFLTNIDFEKVISNSRYDKWRKRNLSIGLVPIQSGSDNFDVVVIINMDSGNQVFFNQTLFSIQKQNNKTSIILYSNHDIPQAIMGQAEKKSLLNLKVCSTIKEIKECLALLPEKYILIMNCGDFFAPGSFAEFQQEIDRHPSSEAIYSDEDSVNEKGEFRDPLFKPDWSPYNLYSWNYLGQSVLIKKTRFLEYIPGTMSNFILMLGVSESSEVIHIPKVLYSKRIDTQTKKINFQSEALFSLKDKVEKQGMKAEVHISSHDSEAFVVNIQPVQFCKISIIIPTKDRAILLKQCIDSIFQLSTYKNFEIIVIDNNSIEKDFFLLMDIYSDKYPSQFKCYRKEIPFNFSDLVNFGVSKSEGEYVVLLNNDTKLITPDWLEKMMGYAQLPLTGAVGVKLLYPDLSIQHCGVVLGIGGAVAHVFLNEDRYSSVYHGYVNMVNSYSAVTAACLMIRKDKYESIGGFDNNFASDYNDIDFCLNLLNKGYYNLYLPEVELYHYESVSRGKSNQNVVSYQRYLKETSAFKKKWMDYIKNDPFYNKNLSRKHVNFNFEPTN